MTFTTKIEVFYGFLGDFGIAAINIARIDDLTFVRSGPSYTVHALLSRVPFALAGLSCSFCVVFYIVYRHRWIADYQYREAVVVAGSRACQSRTSCRAADGARPS